MSTGEGPETPEMMRSARDLDATRARLRRWLEQRLPAGAQPEVSTLVAPEATGMSSETLLFDAAWTEGDVRREESLVARLAPEASAVPVFPVYDLGRQFEVMRLVGERTDVPVPTVLWSEPDPAAIGSPFFVMGRITGQVPPDVMPYTFGGSWLDEGTPEDLRRLQESTVAVLAQIHGLPEPAELVGFLEPPGTGSAMRRNVEAQRAYYRWGLDGPFRSPVIERCFAWLEDHWPDEEGPPVLSWGDARIGNIMYRDFEPVAVLDWEMASLAPPEVDVAWLIFIHRAFDDIARSFGAPGMPDFLRAEDVVATYESLTGHRLRNLDFYLMYAAIRWGMVLIRVGRRRVHFGEVPMPVEVDDLISPRATLEQMADGSYWSSWPAF